MKPSFKDRADTLYNFIKTNLSIMDYYTTSLMFDLIEDALGTVDIYIEEAQVKGYISGYLGGELSAMI